MNVLWRRVRRDQRGVILVMAVPGVVLAVVCLALSIDIGRQVLEKRTDQKIADLAALDAARDLDDAQDAAEASARRNGFSLAAAGHSVLAERGAIDAQRVFSLDPTGDSVRVTITSVVDYVFRPGSRTVRARAVAQLRPGGPVVTTTTTVPTTTTTACPTPPCTTTTTIADPDTAGFTLGSTLASLDTSKAPLYDAVLGQMLQGAAPGGGRADVVGWQGLATSYVTLDALRDELEQLEAGAQFGTVEQMMAADLTLGKLAEATAGVLDQSGDSNAALYRGPGGIVAQATSTATFKLGELFELGAGSGTAVLATKVSAWQLLTGSAMVANGTNVVSVPNAGITVPGISNIALSLKVIEGQKIYIGPVGTPVSTGQVELTVTPTLDWPIEVTGLVAPRLTGDMPYAMTAAGATGTLQGIACPPNGAIEVGVDLEPFSATSSSNLGVRATVLGSSTLLFSVNADGTLAVTDPAPETLQFGYPAEFSPTATGQRVGAAPLDFGGRTTFTATASAVGAEPVPATLDTVVASELKLVVASLGDAVMGPLHQLLGASIGVADVSALKDHFAPVCPVPPPPTTTTTTSATTTTTTTTTPPGPPPSTPGDRPVLVG